MLPAWSRTTVWLASLALVAGFVTTGPAATAQPDPTAHLDMSYVRQVVEDLTSIGSMDMGFRAFGTPQDQQSAQYIADQMTALGLRDVALEPVVGDGWLFEGASVAVGDQTFKAGAFGGVQGTGPEGVSGRLVFVGTGSAQDYDQVGDVTGKIAIAWWNAADDWPNHMAYEAEVRGADALVIAAPPGGAYYQGKGALGSFDATCDLELCAPFVTITTHAAGRLIDRLNAGERLRSTVVLNATVDPGATGYNTIGVIPGSEEPGKVIVLGAHHDAWWYGAADDTSGVAMILALAKAVQESGFQPRYTWVFTTHTGEEYGLADSYYDWLYGAWYQITQEHPEWQSDAVAFLNWEGHAANARLRVNATQDLWGYVAGRLDASSDLLADGYGLFDIYSWNEAWTFGAAGVPSLTFAALGDRYGTYRYHTQLDTIERMDFEGLEPLFQAEVGLLVDLDARTSYPYAFGHRIRTLRASLSPTLMARFGYDDAALMAAVDDLQAAWDTAKAAAPGTDVACYDSALREAARLSLTGLTALSAWDQTIYPHEQVQNDALFLGKAISSLRHGDATRAMWRLWSVANVWYAYLLDKEPFQVEMSHHAPDYPKLSWGGQGKLAPYLDLWDVHEALRTAGTGATHFGAQIRELRNAREDEVSEYANRLDDMTEVLAKITAQLEAAAAC